MAASLPDITPSQKQNDEPVLLIKPLVSPFNTGAVTETFPSFVPTYNLPLLLIASFLVETNETLSLTVTLPFSFIVNIG